MTCNVPASPDPRAANDDPVSLANDAASDPAVRAPERAAPGGKPAQPAPKRIGIEIENRADVLETEQVIRRVRSNPLLDFAHAPRAPRIGRSTVALERCDGILENRQHEPSLGLCASCLAVLQLPRKNQYGFERQRHRMEPFLGIDSRTCRCPTQHTSILRSSRREKSSVDPAEIQ